MNKKENQPPWASRPGDVSKAQPPNIQPSQQLVLRGLPPQLTPAPALANSSEMKPVSSLVRDGQAATSSPYPLHVVLPFDLRDHAVTFDDKRPQLCQVFPGCEDVTEFGNRSYLNFEVETLPPGPWPLTVAGLPFTIIDKAQNGRFFMFPHGLNGRSGVEFCEDLDPSVPSGCDAFRVWAWTIIRTFADRLPQLRVVEFIFTAENHLRVVVADDVDLHAVRPLLPSMVARMYTSYLKDKDLGRPSSGSGQAMRATVPDAAKGRIDDTVYDVLRPGVLVSSFVDSEHESHRLMSAGVLVQSHTGDKFMTTASHGIGVEHTVYAGRPTSHNARLVGDAAVEISFTDVALIALRSGEQFLNERFKPAEGKEQPELDRIIGEEATDEVKHGDRVSMENAFRGPRAAVVMARSIKLENKPPTHPIEDKLRYVVYNWFWDGLTPPESSEDPPEISDSTCGSAIIREDGSVLGFFHFIIEEGKWKGFYAAVSGDEVVKAGYKLVKPTG
ncbi:hypothetical protein Micbo1qcDRAFT_211729 [Microdochium bolleyi]|uniref:Uncharacterized protein n=1 Tax=Microdochium bolleyi TaxID=196109 RepID=A0A136JJY9_9PEZI|nr:hypothetical protein Micbo1qcDRAFT_211729 [Microdochium bolleyi]